MVVCKATEAYRQENLIFNIFKSKIHALKISLYIFFLINCLAVNSFAQELPHFKTIDKTGTTIISWVKPKDALTLLVIQISTDSVNGFKSIASMPDPNAPQNGYADKGNKNLVYYYRIFYVGIDGKYYFTPSQMASVDIPPPISSSIAKSEQISMPVKKEIIEPKKQISQINNPPDTIEIIGKKKLIESALSTMEDTIHTRFNISITTEKIDLVNNLNPNPFLFVNKENNLMLVLPETNKRKFHLQVWREDGQTIFHMKNIKESQLLIDKSNFIYSGWFKYEITEGERVKEKGKFFISGD